MIGSSGRSGTSSGSARRGASEPVEELLEFAFVEAEEVEVAAVGSQPVEQRRQVVLFPLAPLGVVAEGTLAGELVGDVLDDGRDFEHAEVLGGPVAHVAGVDGAVGLGEDRPPPEELGVGLDRAAEVLEALVLDGAGVPGGRSQG